mmetsp:Transcript_5873/g.747  ORF Transcript_5873/g.747 Transcript_5873/m.747 type:complete len:154 (+) Transcript_5873:181-642(+)
MLPNVIRFSGHYALVKLMQYGMMFWLPFILTTQLHTGALLTGILAVLFEIGGILGGIFSGIVSDKIGSRTLVIMPMLVISIPLLILFKFGAYASNYLTYVSVPICGFLIIGANSLISTTVAADLAENGVEGKSSVSTVAGIIDGVGSLGAGLG